MEGRSRGSTKISKHKFVEAACRLHNRGKAPADRNVPHPPRTCSPRQAMDCELLHPSALRGTSMGRLCPTTHMRMTSRASPSPPRRLSIGKMIQSTDIQLDPVVSTCTRCENSAKRPNRVSLGHYWCESLRRCNPASPCT